MAVGAAWSDYLIQQAGSTKGNPLYLYAGAPTDNNAFLFFEGAWETIQPKIADGTFVIKNSSEAVALKDKAELTRDEEAKIINAVLNGGTAFSRWYLALPVMDRPDTFDELERRFMTMYAGHGTIEEARRTLLSMSLKDYDSVEEYIS